jgi:hypothetical protein
MSAFPNSPRLINGGILLVDPHSGATQKRSVLPSQQKARARCFDARPLKRSVR